MTHELASAFQQPVGIEQLGPMKKIKGIEPS